ncbi:GntR family transcriptional regulator [Streptomyces sp. NPDC047002]|uniref:GntR family transcriptional regulator n=1 Tax=Streptomyces sp. NPDC047002 TaxID=3155475 RepID=UPI00345735CE
MPDPTRAARTSASDTAYALTKDLILTGRLPGGSLISEGEIAHRTHLSRTPVREAFLRLQSEDLLELHPKRGAVVVPVTPGEAEDVLELRQALESAAAARLAGRGLAPRHEAHLRELVDDQRARAAARDVEGFAEVDEEFHRAVVDASGNALSSKFYGTLTDRQRRMSVSALVPRPERLAVLADEHAELLGLLLDRDAAAFAVALAAHLTGTHQPGGAAGRDGGAA